jgi:hypothetical protein
MIIFRLSIIVCIVSSCATQKMKDKICSECAAKNTIKETVTNTNTVYRDTSSLVPLPTFKFYAPFTCPVANEPKIYMVPFDTTPPPVPIKWKIRHTTDSIIVQKENTFRVDSIQKEMIHFAMRSDKDFKKSEKSRIIGWSVAGVLALILLIVGLFFYYVQRHNKK